MADLKMSIQQVVKLPEAERYEKAIQKFQDLYNKLCTQVQKDSGKSDKEPIRELTQQIDELQNQKAQATNKVHSRLEKKQPCDDLFSEIAKITEEIRTRVILVKSYLRKEQYPINEEVKQLSSEAFSAGVQLMKIGKEFNENIVRMNNMLQEAINYLQSQKNKIVGLTLQRAAYENNIIRSFGHMNPEDAARYTWDELRTMTFERIKKEWGRG